VRDIGEKPQDFRNEIIRADVGAMESFELATDPALLRDPIRIGNRVRREAYVLDTREMIPNNLAILIHFNRPIPDVPGPFPQAHDKKHNNVFLLVEPQQDGIVLEPMSRPLLGRSFPGLGPRGQKFKRIGQQRANGRARLAANEREKARWAGRNFEGIRRRRAQPAQELVCEGCVYALVPAPDGELEDAWHGLRAEVSEPDEAADLGREVGEFVESGELGRDSALGEI
jgi:hypothetical protein